MFIFISSQFFGGMLGIELGVAGSGSKYANHFAVLPQLVGRLFVQILQLPHNTGTFEGRSLYRLSYSAVAML